MPLNNTKTGRFRRGDASAERPGLLFWGMQRTKECWVTPEKFKEMRLKKNAAAVGFVKSAASKLKESARARARWAALTPEQRKQHAAKQRERNPIYSPRYREKRQAYKRMRRMTDPFFKLKANLGTRIRQGFKRQCTRKQSKCIDLLGCTYEFFKEWIAKQFEPGMSFDSYGFDTWHVDHVIPLCLFNLSEPVTARHAFNYRNCRPAWGKPNLSKNGRLDVSLVAKHNLWEWLPYTSEPLQKAA